MPDPVFAQASRRAGRNSIKGDDMMIEIWTKEKYAGSEEAGFIGRMAHAGLKVKAARLSRLYRVDGDLSRAEFDRLGRELLADPVSERYSLKPGANGFKGAWRVEVWLKDSVTDVVGDSVREAVADVLGRRPERVRFGRAYYALGPSAAAMEAAVRGTLVNQTVNRFGMEKI